MITMVLVSVIVAALAVLAVDTTYFRPHAANEVSQTDRLKLQINSLEARLKAFEEIESRLQQLESENKKVWDTLDHVQNLTENGEKFMKANEFEINNLKKLMAGLEGKAQSLKEYIDHKSKAQATPKSVVVNNKTSRAERSVFVDYKWQMDHNKKKYAWVPTGRAVEYSRAEYLKKLRKKSGKQHNKN